MVKEYIAAIDGMRAVAIGLVISSHLGADRFIPGGFGVTLFFFISGYLITGLMINEHAANGTVSISQFYLRRLLRLAPALLTMIALVSLIFLTVSPIPLAQICAAAFYYMNYYTIFVGGPASAFGPMWSLAVEEHYYLVFPLVFSVAWRHRRHFFAGLAVVTAVILLWRCFLVLHEHVSENRTYLGTDTRMDSILFGATLAIAQRLYPDRIATSSKLLWPAGAAAIIFSFVFRNEVFRETTRYTLQGIALCPLFCATLTNSALSPVKRLLENPMTVWLGRISYSLYLWHFPVLLFANAKIHNDGYNWLAVNLVADLFLACCSYYLIEQHFKKLRERFRPRPHLSPQAVFAGN